MILISSEDIDFYYYDSLEGLEDLKQILLKQELIAFDTETYALKKYGEKASALDCHTSKIRLLQINYPGNFTPHIIDVLKIGADKLLNFVIDIFCNESILKIGHNSKFDVKQMRSTFSVWIKNVHCTMVLMQTLGISVGFKGSQLRKHSLLALARDYFDIHLDKTEGVSDWSAKNLTKEQLEYAALDVGSTKESGIDSIVIQGYKLLKESVCNPNGLNEERAFDIDQKAMYVCARVEYSGLYIDTELLEVITENARNQMVTSRFSLCKTLGFDIQQELVYNEEIDDFEYSIVIPDKIATLLNNNKGLVVYINDFLKKNLGVKLDSLQASELEKALKEIEEEKQNTEEDEDSIENVKDDEFEDYSDYGIQLIRDLLNYKTYNKLLSECKKYSLIVNPVTDRIHAGLNPIGASTSRMSSSGAMNLQQISSMSFKLELDKSLLT